MDSWLKIETSKPKQFNDSITFIPTVFKLSKIKTIGIDVILSELMISGILILKLLVLIIYDDLYVFKLFYIFLLY